MAKTVLYVHGTGVRKLSFEASAARIARGLAAIDPAMHLEPCLWGDRLGARLHLDGVSIPEYDIAEVVPPKEVENLALWELLARDHLFELREMAAMTPAQFDAPRLAQDKSAIRRELPELASNDALLALLDDDDMVVQWQAAIAQIAGTVVVIDALAAARESLGPVRLAIGRAIVASMQESMASRNLPTISKDLRDQLMIACADALGGSQAGGLLDWFSSRLVGLGLNWATARARRQREALYGVAAPTAGDTVMYQARGQAIRDFIENRVLACGDEVYIIAHSLGGIACVDLLIQKALPQVRGLITVGSQAPFLYEIDALSALPYGMPLPAHFPQQWLNFYDCNDLLSYKAALVFPGRAEDIELKSGQPFPRSHSAYWNDEFLWQRLSKLLK